MALADSVSIGNGLLRNMVAQKSFNLNNRFIGQFKVSGLFSSFKNGQAGFNRVLDLFFLRGPLKVLHPIVLLIAVLMVDGLLALRVGYEGLRNDAVNQNLLVNPVFAERDALVSKGHFARRQDLRSKSAFATSLDGKDFSVRTSGIQVFVSRDGLGIARQLNGRIVAHS